MKERAITTVILFAAFSALGFGFSETSLFASTLINKLVMIDPESAIQDQKLEISPNGFFRLKRNFLNGKREYFSFHFSRFKSFDYYGNEAHGHAQIRVADTNIIVQTFQDPEGNVDSMASLLQLDLKDATAEDLSALNIMFGQLHQENSSVKEATAR